MLTDPQALDPARRRAVLLFSGGFDSTLVALLLKQRGIPTVALSVNYGTRPAPERAAAARAAAHLGFAKELSIDVPFGDFRNEPHLWPDQRHEGWFPYRNVIFFGIAAHYAIRERCNVIAAGIRVWDEAFDDARPGYLQRLESLLQSSGAEQSSQRMTLFLPLVASHELALRALMQGGEVAALLRDTWSCWRSGTAPCGECAPCRDRARFFAEAERRRPSA